MFVSDSMRKINFTNDFFYRHSSTSTLSRKNALILTSIFIKYVHFLMENVSHMLLSGAKTTISFKYLHLKFSKRSENSHSCYILSSILETQNVNYIHIINKENKHLGLYFEVF